MDQEQNQGPLLNNGGSPGAPLPDGLDDEVIANTGSRVKAIVVAAAFLVVIVGGVFWYNSHHQTMVRHENAREMFQNAHLSGYQAFWTKAQINIKETKNNQVLQEQIDANLGEDSLRYAKHIKEKCLPILNEALPKYKSIEASVEYQAETAAIAAAAQALYDAWNTFATDILGIQPHLDAKKKLTESGNAWVGAQTSNDKKYTAKAVNYLNTLKCTLKDQILFELDPSILKQSILDSCTTEPAGWFRRVTGECTPLLLLKNVEPDEIYTTTLEKYKKADMHDHASVFGLEDCLKSTQEAFEAELSEGVARAWVGYVKAQNSLIDAIKKQLNP